MTAWVPVVELVHLGAKRWKIATLLNSCRLFLWSPFFSSRFVFFFKIWGGRPSKKTNSGQSQTYPKVPTTRWNSNKMEKKSHMLPKTCLQRVFCIPSDTFYFSVWNYKSAMKTDFARVIRVNLCDGTCQRISTTIWGLPVNQKLMQTNSVTKCVYKQTTVVFWQTCNCVLPNWM